VADQSSSDTRATSARLVSSMSLVFGGAGLVRVVASETATAAIRAFDPPLFLLFARSWKYVVCSWVHFPESRDGSSSASCYNYAWFSSVSLLCCRLWTVRCVVLMCSVLPCRLLIPATVFVSNEVLLDETIFLDTVLNMAVQCICVIFDHVWLVTAVSILDQSRSSQPRKYMYE
jgi:hypothetical protein